MKPTLNEEIGMSQQGIDYVNSLEVVKPEFPNDRYEKQLFCNSVKNNIPEEIEKQRIKKEALNNLIFVAIVLIIVVIVNWKS